MRYSAPDGTRVYVPTLFETRVDAARHLADVELKRRTGQWIHPKTGRVRVEEWAGRWLASSAHLRPKTRVSYASLLRVLVVPKLGAVAVGDLRPMQVREWVAELLGEGFGASRVRQAYRLLSQVMRAAQLDGLIEVSPCVGVRLPPLPDHEPVVLAPEEVAKLVAVLAGGDRLFVATLAYTGLRFGEAAALSRRSVDVEGRRLRVVQSLSDADGVLTLEEPKSHQHRSVTLPASLADELGEHLERYVADRPDALVFTSPTGMPLRHPNFMRRVWAPAVLAAGLDGMTPHDLRASHASWLYDQGWSPVEIGARLGHSRATVTTKHYARPMVGRDREIAVQLDAVLRESGELWLTRRWEAET